MGGFTPHPQPFLWDILKRSSKWNLLFTLVLGHLGRGLMVSAIARAITVMHEDR